MSVNRNPLELSGAISVAENDMHEHDLSRASALVGHDVQNALGEPFGRIEEVVVDLTTGRLALAVLSFDDSVEVDWELYAIPWRALSRDPERDEYKLDATKDKLENAPGFDRDRWPDMADRTWGAEISAYWGHRPYWEVVVG
jgi:sporulation protein YlmC with PRC-barrel domain